jgi:Uma2 family endonuclease
MVTLVIPTDVASVKGPPQSQWTYADWETLPDDGNRYEIIDGYLYASGVPSIFHQWIVKRLYRFLGIPAEEQQLAFSAVARVGVVLSQNTVMQPDFVIVLMERAAIIHDRRIRGVPDLIVEVLSPGNPDYDQEVKMEAYAKAGVPEYVIIDPSTRTLKLFQLVEKGQYAEPQVFKEGNTLSFACLPTSPLEVGKLFADSPDTTL